MARAWVYDRTNTKEYKDAVKKARENGKRSPSRWMVRYYKSPGKLKSEAAANKTRAELRCTELEASLAVGTYLDPSLSKVLFETMAESWLETRHDIRPSTWWKYRRLLDNHVLPHWGPLALSAIMREDIEVWVAHLLKSKKDGGAGLGASQTRHCYRVLAMVLEWCVPHRLPRNLAVKVKLPVRPEAEHIYLTYLQVECLADAAGSLLTKYNRPTASAAINRALILLLAYTGMRWGEAAALRIGRIDLAKRRIRIVSTVYEIGGSRHEGPPKSGKPRTVALPASLVPELRVIIADRDDDELVFTTARGAPLMAHNWRTREFNPAVKAAGLKIPGLTPHKLRHTAASLAIAAGADVKVLQTMLGHSDASMTLNVYGHLWPDRLDEVADTLDAKRVETLALAA